MKGHWLYGGLALFSLGLISAPLNRLLLGALWLLVLSRSVNKKALVRITVLILLMLIRSFPNRNLFTQGRVAVKKDNYVIVRNLNRCLILYGQNEEIGLDDVIKISKKELKEVESYGNFETAGFLNWAYGQEIYWQGSLEKAERVSEGVSIRRLLYDQLQKRHNQGISQLLFGTGSKLEGEYRYFLSQSGMHVSFLARWLEKRFGRKCYSERALRLTANIMILLGWIFRFPFGFARVIFGLLARIFYQDKRDRSGWLICMLCLLWPNYVRSLAFMVPLGLRVLQLFQQKKKKSVSYLYMTAVMLVFNGYVDLLSIVLFSPLSFMAGLMYLAALLVSWLPFKVPLFDVLPMIDEELFVLKTISLNGKMSVLLLAVLLKVLIEYSRNEQKRLLTLAIMLILLPVHQGFFKPYYSVTFLDIGQAECAVITRPFSRRAVLIDAGATGYKDTGSDLIMPYLRSLGVRKIDVFISHYDYDHYGSLAALKEYFDVTVHDKKQPESNANGIQILHPLHDKNYESLNDDSLLCYMKCDKAGFLFTGDISSEVEEDLVREYAELDVTVLKAAHHGSKESNGELLLSTYKMPYAVISAGRDNVYGHPHRETLGRFKSFQVRSYVTATDQAVRFKIFRGLMVCQTSAGSFSFFML